MNRKKKKSGHSRDEKGGDPKSEKKHKRKSSSTHEDSDHGQGATGDAESDITDSASRTGKANRSQKSLSGLFRRSEDRSKSSDISLLAESTHNVDELDDDMYNTRTEPRTTLKRMTVREALTYSRARGKSPGRPTEKLEKVVLDNEKCQQQENLSSSVPFFLDQERGDNRQLSGIDWDKLKSSGSTLPRTRRRKPHSDERRPYTRLRADTSVPDISDSASTFHNLPLDKRKYIIDKTGTHHSDNHLAEIHPTPSHSNSNDTNTSSLPTNSQSFATQEANTRPSFSQFKQLRHTLPPFSSSQSIGKSTDSQPDDYRTLLNSLNEPNSIPYTPPLTEAGKPVVLPTYEEATSTASCQSWVQNSSVPSEISGTENEPDHDIISPVITSQLEQNVHDRDELHGKENYDMSSAIQKAADNLTCNNDTSRVNDNRIPDVKRKRTSYVSPRRFSRSSRASTNSNKSNISEESSLAGQHETISDTVVRPTIEMTQYKRKFSGNKGRRKKSESTLSTVSDISDRNIHDTDSKPNTKMDNISNSQNIDVVPLNVEDRRALTGLKIAKDTPNVRKSRADTVTITRSAADVFIKLLINKNKYQETEELDEVTTVANSSKSSEMHKEENGNEDVNTLEAVDNSSSSTTVNADIGEQEHIDACVQTVIDETHTQLGFTGDKAPENKYTTSDLHDDIEAGDDIYLDGKCHETLEIPIDKNLPADIVIIDADDVPITSHMETENTYSVEEETNLLHVDNPEGAISDSRVASPERIEEHHDRKMSSKQKKKTGKKSVKEKKVKGILKRPKDEQKHVAASVVNIGRAASLTDICYRTSDPEYEQLKRQKLKRTKTATPRRTRSKEDVTQVNTKLTHLPAHRHQKDPLPKDTTDGKKSSESKTFPKLSLNNIVNFKLRLARIRKTKKAKPATKEASESEEILPADTVNDEEQDTDAADKLDKVGYENQINVSLENLADNNESELVEGDIINQGTLYEKKIHFQSFTDDEIVSEDDLIKKRQKNTRLTGRRESKVRQRQKKVISCCKTFVAFLFSHIGLSSLVVAYCILGGFIFKELEGKNELIKKAEIVKIRQEYLRRIWDVTFDVQLNKKSREDFDDRVNQLLRNFSIRIQKETKESGWDGKDNSDHPEQWTFPSSLLYAITVMTTIVFKECFFFNAKKGYTTDVDELAFIMRSLNYSPTLEEVSSYFQKYVKDGKIDFASFLEVMHYHNEKESSVTKSR